MKTSALGCLGLRVSFGLATETLMVEGTNVPQLYVALRAAHLPLCITALSQGPLQGSPQKALCRQLGDPESG